METKSSSFEKKFREILQIIFLRYLLKKKYDNLGTFEFFILF